MSSWLIRLRPGLLVVFGTSAIGGAAYRSFKPFSSSDASLNTHTFTPYTLVDKQPVSSTSAIFTLRHNGDVAEPESVREAWKRSVWSLQVKQPQLQIARAYTPLPARSNTNVGEEARANDVRLLIRAEEGGEVSNYLHRLPEQSTIELRGPNVECELPHDIKEVIFLAGGTGIAPAMQVAQAMSGRTASRMHILWANRLREECIGGVSDEGPPAASQHRPGWWKSFLGLAESAPQKTVLHGQRGHEKGLIVRELEALKEHSESGTRSLEVQYYVDEENSFVRPADVAKRLHVPSSDEGGSKLILVSGPNGFIEHWAGKKVWAGGREAQGPLGGALGKMDLNGWEVFKL